MKAHAAAVVPPLYLRLEKLPSEALPNNYFVHVYTNESSIY